jgi:hypothetical protein
MKRATLALVGKKFGLLAAAFFLAATLAATCIATAQTKQLEAPTLENINAIIDHNIGYLQRGVAMIRDLQTRNEQEPLGLTNPEAIALHKEVCAIIDESSTINDAYLATVGFSPRDDGRAKEAAQVRVADGAGELEEQQRYIGLWKEFNSAIRELSGMGFGCKAVK